MLKYFKKPVFMTTEEDGSNQKFFYEGTNKEVPAAEITQAVFLHTKEDALLSINKYAKIYQERLAPSNLVEEYRRKETAANAYKNNLASNADKEILQTEADILGIDIADHVQSILLKVALFDHVWAQIVKFRTETKLAVQAAKTPEAIEAILLAAKQQADAAFASLGE